MLLKKQLIISFLITLTTVLSILLFVYTIKQNHFFLESNNLYSKESVLLTKNPRDLLKHTKLKDSIIIFKQLSDDDSIRAILTNNFKLLNFPIYDGKNFEHVGKQALVGSNIPLTLIKDKNYYIYNNELYEVIGLLGTENKSLLSDSVLINDPDLFSNKPESLIIDGKKTHVKLRTLFRNEKIEEKTSGVLNKKTNIDFVSPLLILFILCILFLSCFLKSPS